MSLISFADVVHQSISFSKDDPAERLVLELIDAKWVQRLRDISQTANTRLVFMFSEHSRFGHCVGVAYLANLLLASLARKFPHEVEKYRLVVNAAAILHDIGHMAPGSHTAYKAWFPGQGDLHEELSCRIIKEDPEILSILSKYDPELPSKVCALLMEEPGIPPWCSEALSGGGWNVDRGNWCIVDSILAGVSYGKYNIPALIDSMSITQDGHLALMENRLDAMIHFAVSRHAMYRQIYQHRVILAADTLNRAIVQRARDLNGKVEADSVMKAALGAKRPYELSLDQVFRMREPWWRYHMYRWSEGEDATLRDLAQRLLERRLFKTVRILNKDEREGLIQEAKSAVQACGLDPAYYFHTVSTIDVQAGESKHSMMVVEDTGKTRRLIDAEPLFSTLLKESGASMKEWIVIPGEAKERMGRAR